MVGIHLWLEVFPSTTNYSGDNTTLDQAVEHRTLGMAAMRWGAATARETSDSLNQIFSRGGRRPSPMALPGIL